MFGGVDVHIQVNWQIRPTLTGTGDPDGTLELLVWNAGRQEQPSPSHISNPSRTMQAMTETP